MTRAPDCRTDTSRLVHLGISTAAVTRITTANRKLTEMTRNFRHGNLTSSFIGDSAESESSCDLTERIHASDRPGCCSDHERPLPSVRQSDAGFAYIIEATDHRGPHDFKLSLEIRRLRAAFESIQ